MKKVLLSAVLLLCAQQTLACRGEAQIIAEVEGHQIVNPSACFVVLNPMTIRFYAENQACPLDQSEVISAGVEVGLHKEDTCNIGIGEELNGLIYKDVDGTLRLER